MVVVPVEAIPDADSLHRLIDSPPLYDDARGLIWDLVFQFPKSQDESVIWSKYASSDEQAHKLGCEREARYRLTKPNRHYVGFISSTAGAVRGIRTAAGHGFAVWHQPEEGVYHAGIAYRPADGPKIQQLSTNEKNELKLALRLGFGPLVRRTCP